jgi:hypothetical protein
LPWCSSQSRRSADAKRFACSNQGRAGSKASSKLNQLQENTTTAQAMTVLAIATSESSNDSRITASFRTDRFVAKARGGYTRRRKDARSLRSLLP